MNNKFLVTVLTIASILSVACSDGSITAPEQTTTSQDIPTVEEYTYVDSVYGEGEIHNATDVGGNVYQAVAMIDVDGTYLTKNEFTDTYDTVTFRVATDADNILYDYVTIINGVELLTYIGDNLYQYYTNDGVDYLMFHLYETDSSGNLVTDSNGDAVKRIAIEDIELTRLY